MEIETRTRPVWTRTGLKYLFNKLVWLTKMHSVELILSKVKVFLEVDEIASGISG